MKFEIKSILYEWDGNHEDIELYKKLLLKLPFISYNEDTKEMIGIIDTIENLEVINDIAKAVSINSKENCIFSNPDLLVNFRDKIIYIRDFYAE